MISKDNKLFKVLTETQYEDKSGSTPVLKFSEKAKRYHPGSSKVMWLKLWMVEIAENIEELNFEQIQTFASFFYISEIRIGALFKILKNKLLVSFSQNSPDEIHRRAEILRFVVEQSSFFTSVELEEEGNIRNNFPWHFADCLIERCYVKTMHFIYPLFEQCGNDVGDLIHRINAWQKKIPDQQFRCFLRTILSKLEGQQKERLEEALKRRNIKIII